MVAHGAKYHQTCRLQYNNTKLQRAQKRDEEQPACKLNRLHSRSSSTEKVPETCFFCEQPAGADSLRKASTFQLDRRVRDCATFLCDAELLVRLSGGDMIALGAQYHPQCLIGLYNRTRKAQSTGSQDTNQERAVSAVVFAELVLYIEETRQDEETAPVFILTDLVQLCQSRMEQLGVHLNTRVHPSLLLNVSIGAVAVAAGLVSAICSLMLGLYDHTDWGQQQRWHIFFLASFRKSC